MPRGPTLRQADVERVIRALAAHGLAPGRIEIAPGGTVVITPAPLTAPDGGVPMPDQAVSSLDDWRARKRGAGAD
jgi:hypothetical protein